MRHDGHTSSKGEVTEGSDGRFIFQIVAGAVATAPAKQTDRRQQPNKK